MQIQVTGKNVDIGDSLRSHIVESLTTGLEKYFNGTMSAHVTVTRQRGDFRADCSVHLSSGIDLQSHGQAGDAYASFDEAGARLEKRLRRYSRRLKDHHNRGDERGPARQARAYVIAAGGEDEPEPEDLAPVIVAENMESIAELTVGEAVMRLDLAQRSFVVFHNASHGRINVVFRREDGNFGWIDPPLDEDAKG